LLVATLVAQTAIPRYDVKAETTLKGAVDEVREVPGSCSGQTGLHLVLNTDAGKLEVQIAPPEFLKEMDVRFAKGDQVQILGSKLMLDGKPFMLAREITQSNNVLVVRDRKGDPVWTWMKRG
jgi:DNA/RNA endonuclease YhcR with UshA esterase domain